MVLCPHCDKDPTWQFYFTFFAQRSTLWHGNQYVCPEIVLDDLQSVHIKTRVIEIDWHVFGLCTINCISINKKTILALAGVAFNSKGFRNTKG